MHDRRHFENHVVEVDRGKVLHDLRLAEGIIEGRINQLWLDTEARRLIAIDGNGELWGV